jgi:glutamine amidotransferase
MYRRLGFHAEPIASPRTLMPGDRLILPGVGAFDHGMNTIQQSGFADYICSAVADGYPLLGICLGMQLLGRGSEEGAREGFGLIAADVRRIVPDDPTLRVPHMGWNIVRPVRVNSLVPLEGEEQRFYFVHGYHMICDDAADVIATTPYGGDLVSAVEHNNIWGVQFHPEKSHRFGKNLLERFAMIGSTSA